MPRLAALAVLLLGSHSLPVAAADASPQSITTIGPMNTWLTNGTAALEAGRFEEGVRLTLLGLEQSASARDQAAAHSNICAGLVALKRYDDALIHCNSALELDRSNWRTFNNRAAAFVGLKQLDLALTDVNSGLALSPNSATLKQSREVVKQHRRAEQRERRRRTRRSDVPT